MAKHASAKKRHRQSLKNNSRNRMVRTRIKNVVKSVRAAVKGKEQEGADQALGTAMSVLDKAASRGVIHWKKAARQISRLSRAVNSIA